MAEVYRATDSVLGRPVAVKLLAERHARDHQVRARFEREGRAAARLSGAAHVITVFDVGEHDGRPLIVMEYLAGGSLHDRLLGERVSREQALEWLEQIAQALDSAHAHGIVHRDVKPANLLLDRDGSIQVSDFGIATAPGQDTLTLPGTVLGTAGYLSPEQARGEPASPASDRYALGVIAFELLTGRRPFARDTPMTEAFAHLNAPVPSASTVDSSLPPAVDAVFARALAKEPDARPGSSRELVADLRAALASSDAQPVPVDAGAPTLVLPARTRRVPPSPASVRPSRRARRRNSAALTLVAVGVLAAGLGTSALLDATRDAGGERRPADSQPTTTSTQPTETEAPAAPSGADLNDAGYARMQAGDYDGALPLLRDAVHALSGSGSLTEAYASYNLAFTRFALGRCDGVTGLLDRSEGIQGERVEIDRLRGEWDARCGDGGEGRGNGKGKGQGKKGGED